MKRVLSKIALQCMPKRTMTAVVGRFARSSLSRKCIPMYVKYYGIDTTEAERPVSAYPNLVEFFSRKLQADARPVAETGIACPVDGTVSEYGLIREGQLLQAKGCEYTVAALIGSHEAAKPFVGGQYITLYLSPKDYHRIHIPLDGVIKQWQYIPGNLYPVNSLGVSHIPGLFTKNERLVTWIHSAEGVYLMVKVGATIVGSIRTPYGPSYEHAYARGRRAVTSGDVALRMTRGQEIGHFEFGSTVILLFEPGMISDFCVTMGQKVRMGQRIASLTP